jgi:phage gp16-like protein
MGWVPKRRDALQDGPLTTWQRLLRWSYNELGHPRAFSSWGWRSWMAHAFVCDELDQLRQLNEELRKRVARLESPTNEMPAAAPKDSR